MSHQKVPAGSGLQWITDAVNLILKNPAPFLLMGLVIAIVSIVPIIGSLALLILGPALYGGIMYAAREQDSGRAADFQQLFQAFKEEGKLGKMLMLCLPAVAAAVIIGVLGVIFLGGALLGAGVAGNNGNSAIGMGLGLGGLLFALIALAVGIASYALTFFATPRVMLDGADPIPAMKDSLQACLSNIGAVAVYALIVVVALCVLMVTLGLIPLLGSLVVVTAATPIVSVAGYQAWRQVYRQAITQEIPPAAPPVPPSNEF